MLLLTGSPFPGLVAGICGYLVPMSEPQLYSACTTHDFQFVLCGSYIPSKLKGE